MIDTILVLTQSKFTKRDYKRFGVSEYLKAGFGVLVYDLSPMLQSPHYQNSYHPEDEITDEYVYRCSSIQDCADQILPILQRVTIALNFINLDIRSKPIYEFLSDHKIRYCQFQIFLQPDVRPIFRQLLSKLKFDILFGILNPRIAAASVVIYAGTQGRRPKEIKYNKGTRFVAVGSVDYNTYIDSTKDLRQKAQSGTLKNYFVFIDESFPSHPDYQGKNLIDPKYYYDKVNSYLTDLRTWTSFEPVIAEHPRAEYGTNPFAFPMYKGKTAELVIDSQFVVGHASTSFSFAILAMKPIIQLGFESLKGQFYGRYVTCYNKLLGTHLQYLDSQIEFPRFSLNEKAYEKYISDFVVEDLNPKILLPAEGVLSYICKERDVQ